MSVSPGTGQIAPTPAAGARQARPADRVPVSAPDRAASPASDTARGQPAGSVSEGGALLPGNVRHRLEAVVGGDLSEVRIHTGPAAVAHTARAGALATTQGHHITFGPGMYRPGTVIGEAVLAHELAHTRQQAGPAGGAPTAHGVLERQADRAGLVAAMRLLDPTGAAGLTPPRLSQGQGLCLQRCAPPDYSEIEDLPTREQYERRGELPRRLLGRAVVDLTGFPAGLIDLPGLPPNRFTDPAPPRPVDVEREAPLLTPEQLTARLDVLEARQRRIDATLTDLDNWPRLVLTPGGAAPYLPGANIMMARLGVGRPDASSMLLLELPGMPPPQPDELLPKDAEELSRRIAGADVVQERALEMLTSLKATREDEQTRHASLDGYDLAAALDEIDGVRRDYRDATDRVLTGAALPALKVADERNAGLQRYLTGLKVAYYAQRTSKYEEIQDSIREIHTWATELQGDLDRLTRSAESLQEARRVGDPHVLGMEAAFDADAQMIATSLEALSEWDTAVSAFEILRGNSALWGFEGVDRIAGRLVQMRDAAVDKDLPYLQILLRDHRADKAVHAFYAKIPSIIETSHLIIGLFIVFVAAVATAGVGVLISAAGSAVASGVAASALAGGATVAEAGATAGIVLNATFVVKIGMESLVFTVISRQLTQMFPGMKVSDSFWAEFAWNLGMFGLMHGASKVAGALIESLAVRGAVATAGIRLGVSYAALEAFGYVKFAVEAGRTMTLAEFGKMSLHNLVMLAALTVAMKPLQPLLARTEASLTSELGRFSRTYGPRITDLAAQRDALETSFRERMTENPQAAEKDVADLRDQAEWLDIQMNKLVEDVAADPSTNVPQLRAEVEQLVTRTQVTSVAEMLSGLEPGIDLLPTGTETSWSFAAGQARTLSGELRSGGYEVTSETTLGGGNAVIETRVPGKGDVTFVERPPGAEVEAATATPGAPAAATAKPAVTADVPGGEPPAAQGSASVRWLMELSARLAKARGGVPTEPGVVDSAEASAELSHAKAIQTAMQDAVARAGLRTLSTFHPRSLPKILAAVPVENMPSFLRATAKGDLGKQTPQFYQALGRSSEACRLVEGYGGVVLLKVVHLQKGAPPGVQVARARVDIDRVLVELERMAADTTSATGGPAAAEALAAKIRAFTVRSTFRSLDRLVGPRSKPSVQIEPDLKDPNWKSYQAEANEHARTHPPEGGALDVTEKQLRAALIQTVERARAGEYSNLDGREREVLLRDFDTVAEAARLDRGWISAKRGQLFEALAVGQGTRSEPTVWLNGKVVFGRVPKGSTMPDEASPRVTASEIADRSVETKARLWHERKDYVFDRGDVDASGVSVAGRSAATQHLKEARGDLENLPPGSSIAIEYGRDPGPVTRLAMARILLAEPRIVRVTFAGKSVAIADLPAAR